MRSPLRVLDRRKALALTFSAVAAASAVALAVFEHQSSHRPIAAARPVATPTVDPLAAEFARCQALGDAGARDPGCLAAWAESRRRFLTPNSRDNGPKPVPQTRPRVGQPEDQ